METLLAVTLFVIVSISSVSIFRLGLEIWKRSRDVSKNERRVLLTMEKMGQDLRSMIRLPSQKEGEFKINEKTSFEYKGTSTEIQIPSVYGPGVHPLLGGYGRTTYRWDIAKREICRSLETAVELYKDGKPECRVMATSVYQFKIRYWLPSGLEDSYSWYDSWNPDDGMPLAVEVSLEVRAAAPSTFRRQYKKTFVVPVGGKNE